MADVDSRTLSQRNPALVACEEDIRLALERMLAAVQAGGKILVCGNGGSAADAEHIVGELLKGFNLPRPLPADTKDAFRDAFGERGAAIADKLQQAIAAVSLVSQTGLITAVANDTDARLIFAQQIMGLGRPGDVLLAISTSGNSGNVLDAAMTARVLGLTVIGLIGRSGGKLKDLCHVAIRVPADHVAAIQELHLPVYHWLCTALEAALFGAGPRPMTTAGAGRKVLPNPIQLLVFDFDGVFTDNKVYTDQDGRETVLCDRRDSLGLDGLRKRGVPMLILSTEANPVVAARARKIGLEVASDCRDKALFLRHKIATEGLDPARVVYMGNDLNDLDAMGLAGYSVAPRDAHPEVLRLASLVVDRPGGDGAVRALCDLILEAMA